MENNIIKYLEQENLKHKNILDDKTFNLLKIFFDGEKIPKDMVEIEKIKYFKSPDVTNQSNRKNAFLLSANISTNMPKREPKFNMFDSLNDIDNLDDLEEVNVIIFKDDIELDIIYNYKNKSNIKIQIEDNYKYLYSEVDTDNKERYYILGTASDNDKDISLEAVYCNKEVLELIQEENKTNEIFYGKRKSDNLVTKYNIGKYSLEDSIELLKDFMYSPIEFIESQNKNKIK